MHCLQKKLLICIFLILPCLLEASPESIEVSEKVSSVYQAIVRIEVVSETGSNGRMLKTGSLGSGVIIDESGLVVTNHHVAGKATRLTCRLHDGEEIAADLIGADALTDLAVLRLRLEERNPGSSALQVAIFGDSDLVEVGDVCFAMGSPAGLSQSVTRGIISNLALMSNRLGSFRLDGEYVGELVRWLGHDAVIFPGNSGGPLVNQQGKIIGINEVSIASLGGAIPSNLAQSIAEELSEKGYIERSWTGLECQPSLDDEKPGILVSGVIPDSPAKLSRFQPGDLITHFQGRPVQAMIPEDLPPFHQQVCATPPGTVVQMAGFRADLPIKWSLTTQKREPANKREKELKNWGLTLRDLTLFSSLEARRQDSQGAQVHSVAQGGPCFSAKPGLAPGDIITEVDGHPILQVSDLVEVSRKITSNQPIPVPVLVRFERNLATFLTVVKIGPQAEGKGPLEAWKPWLGVSTQVITRDLSQALSLPPPGKGVRISQVFPDTPAEQAGLKTGDFIFRLDRQIIQAHRPEDYEVFGNMIKQYRIGSTISLEILRDDQIFELNATLDKRPTPGKEMPEFEDEQLEFTVRELSFADRVFMRLEPHQNGLLVENVESAGWAALAGLKQGDLLLEMNGSELNNTANFKEKMQVLSREMPQSVLFFVQRGIHTLFIEIQPEWGPS